MAGCEEGKVGEVECWVVDLRMLVLGIGWLYAVERIGGDYVCRRLVTTLTGSE
jgi:hypothetical protein